MEIFLIVTIVTKRKSRTLRMGVKLLPDVVIPIDRLQQSLGNWLTSARLHLQRPIGSRPTQIRQNLMVHTPTQNPTPPRNHSCKFVNDNRNGPFGYRIQFPCQISRMEPEVATSSPDSWKCPPGSVSDFTPLLEYGKWPYFQEMSEWDADLESRFKGILAQHPEICRPGNRLQFDDSTSLLRFESYRNSGVEEWIVGVETWHSVASPKLEDWVSHRIAQMIHDRTNRNELLLGLVENIHLAIHQKEVLFGNLLVGFKSSTLDLREEAELPGLLDSVVELLVILQKFVCNSVSEVLIQAESPKLVCTASKQKSEWRSTEGCSIGIAEELADTLRIGISRFSFHAHDSCGISRAYLTHTNTEMWLNDCCRSVWRIFEWTKQVVGTATTAESIWTKLTALCQHEGQLGNLTIQPPSRMTALAFLHQDIKEFLAQIVSQKLKEYSRTLHYVDPTERVSPLAKLGEFSISWAVKAAPDLMVGHIKSQTSPDLEFIAKVKGQTALGQRVPISWVEDQLFRLDQLKFVTFLASNYVWVVQVVRNEQMLIGITRIDLEAPSPPPKQFALVLEKDLFLDCFPWSTIALDDSLILVHDDRGLEKCHGFEMMDLKIIKAADIEPSEYRSNVPKNLLDRSTLKSMCNLNRHFKQDTLSIAKEITVTSDQTMFVRFLDTPVLSKQKGLRKTMNFSRKIGLVLYKLKVNELEYKMINFETWVVQTGGEFFDEKRTNSIFQLRRTEYFLSSVGHLRLLVAFGPKLMQLVYVAGKCTHRVPADIGEPVELLGLSSPESGFVYSRRIKPTQSRNCRFVTSQIRYT